MKIASRILSIVGIVSQVMNVFLSAILLSLIPMIPPIDAGSDYTEIFLTSFYTSYFTTFGVTMIIMAIPGIIFGILALVQLSKPGKPSTGISVCTLIFCNVVAGILMLCIPEKRTAPVEPVAVIES